VTFEDEAVAEKVVMEQFLMYKDKKVSVVFVID